MEICGTYDAYKHSTMDRVIGVAMTPAGRELTVALTFQVNPFVVDARNSIACTAQFGFLPMPLELFNHRSPQLAGTRHASFPGPENKNCWHLAMAGGYIYILGMPYRHALIGVTRTTCALQQDLFSGFCG